MSTTVTRLFATLGGAKAAIHGLEELGVSGSEISLIYGSDDRHLANSGEHLGDHDPAIGEEAKKGAIGGASVGVGLGLLGGLALLPIPGIGPVLGVGWLVATLTTAVGGAAVGTAMGGLVATLTHHGLDEYSAGVYAEGVRRGNVLVSARVHDDKAAAAEQLMAREALDVAGEGRAYEASGWTPETRPVGAPVVF